MPSVRAGHDKKAAVTAEPPRNRASGIAAKLDAAVGTEASYVM